MKVTVEIPNKLTDYMLRDAPRHIAYWANECTLTGQAARVCDGEKWYRFSLKRGLTVMAEKSPKRFGEMLAGNYDGSTCDLLVQYGCFGEAVYG